MTSAEVARSMPADVLRLAKKEVEAGRAKSLSSLAGVLCGRAGTSDVVDASVVMVARRERAPIVTSDVGDLRRLDPSAVLERI